jgi:Ran-binding protein 1
VSNCTVRESLCYLTLRHSDAGQFKTAFEEAQKSNENLVGQKSAPSKTPAEPAPEEAAEPEESAAETKEEKAEGEENKEATA